MRVGREIRQRREEKGWSQAKLAAAADMGVSGVSQIETGARNPSAVTLEKLAKALGVGVADLFPKAQPPLPELDDGRQREQPEEPEEKLKAALVIMADSLAERMKDYVEELRKSGDELPLDNEAWLTARNSWALRTIHDATPPDVRGAPEVQEAMRKVSEASHQIDRLASQWFGPTALDPDQWEERLRFSRKRGEEGPAAAEDAPRHAEPGA